MPLSLLPSAVDRLRSSSASQSNIQLILEHDKKLAGNRISDEHRKKFIDRLRWWAEYLKKDFRKATKEDLEAGYEAIKARKDLKVGTINFYITMLRQFYKWLEGDDEEFPKKVRHLKPLAYQPELISEYGESSIQIYSVEELERMIKLGRSAREKCLVALSYDCGGRLNEILSLKMGNIKREPPFYKIYLHGDKTWKRARVGKRWVGVYFAVPYINEFLKSHPSGLEDKDAPLWINSGKYGGRKNAQLSQAGFKTLFDRLKAKAGIKGKRFHDLRHTKATHLLRLGMHEGKIKKYMGWSMNSKQLARYVHLVQEDIDEELSRMYGIPFTRRKYDDIPIPVKCNTCGEVNSAGSDLCSKCNNPISSRAITNATTKERYWRQKYEKKFEMQMEKIQESQEAQKKDMDGIARKLADITVHQTKRRLKDGQ